jgi:hypothetical protein
MEILVVLAIIWIGLGVLCAATAAGKNRSAAGWFICGMFLGLIAFVILLCLPKGEARGSRGYSVPASSGGSPASKDPFSGR